MTDLFNIDKFRVYLGQASDTAGSQFVYSSDFDAYKQDVSKDVQSLTLVRQNERGNSLQITLSNPDNRYKDAYPIQFGYGVEVKYVVSASTIEDADAVTNWSTETTPFVGPTLDQNILRSKTGSIKYTTNGSTGPSDTIDVTGLGTSATADDVVEMWVRSSRAIDAGDITLKLYNYLVSYNLKDTVVNLNAIPASTWTRVRFEAIDSLIAPFTLAKVEIIGDGVWQSGDSLWFDQLILISDNRWVFKGSIDPVDLFAAPSKNVVDIDAYGVGGWADNLLMSRDYIRGEWRFIEDVAWDIVYNLTCLNTKYGVELYVPVDGTPTLMDDLGDVDAEYKHPLNVDFRFRDISPDNALSQLATAARIGYYFHTDPTSGELRLTLKSRDTITADYTVEGEDYEVGTIVRKIYNKNVVSKVVVKGKDVSASQVSREVMDADFTKPFVVVDGSLETYAACAERAHFEMIQKSPNDEVVTLTLNPANEGIGYNYLFIDPYDVIDVTDTDVNLANENLNVIDQTISIRDTIEVEWTLGEVYKELWLRFYEFMDTQQNTDTDVGPKHYRSTHCRVSLGYDYFIWGQGTVGGDVTISDRGKEEIARCFTTAFFKHGDAQRFMRGYVADSGGLLADLAALEDMIFFTVDDTNQIVRAYLSFQWTNGTGFSKTIDHFYPAVDTITEVVEEITEASTTVKVRDASGASTDKMFTIEFRNTAKVIWTDGSTEFAVDYPDLDIFQNSDVLSYQDLDGTTGTVTVTVNANDQILSKTAGTLPDVGAIVYLDDEEECVISSVSFGETYDTITVSSAISRTIQAGAKVVCRFIYAFENATDIGKVVANGADFNIYLVLTFTADDSTSDENASMLTKEGLLFLANQLIGDPGTSQRRWYKTQDLYSAVGNDNTTALSYTWNTGYQLALTIDGAWVASAFTVTVDSGTVSSLTAVIDKSKFESTDLGGVTDFWNGYDLVFYGDCMNTGQRIEIVDWDAATDTITLANDLPFFPEVGDTFYIEPPIEVGDYILYETTGASPERFSGVSGSDEQRIAYLKVTDYTGGPPRDTVQLEGSHSLGSNPTDDVVYLVGRETISSEIGRAPANVATVTQGYDTDKYTLKFISVMGGNQVGVETDSNGIATGYYNEVSEVGIFTEPAVTSSEQQYYLSDVSYSGESVGLGHGDDPYDNKNAVGVKLADDTPPRSDDFNRAYGIQSVKGMKTGRMYAPLFVRMGTRTAITAYDSTSFEPSQARGYVSGYLLGDVSGIISAERYRVKRGPAAGDWTSEYVFESVGESEEKMKAANWGRVGYAVHLITFRLPDDISKDELKSVTLYWGGVSNRPIYFYIHENPDHKTLGLKNSWVQLEMRSGVGLNPSEFSSTDSGDERYFFGSVTYSGDVYKVLSPKGDIVVMVAAGEDGIVSPYLSTDYVLMDFVSDTATMQQGKGTYRKGIDYYYDINNPQYLWWDYVDPIELVDYVAGLRGENSDGSIVLYTRSTRGLSIGSNIYIEDDDGNMVPSSILRLTNNSLLMNAITIDGTYVDINKISTGSAIYMAQMYPTNTVTVNGKEYVKNIPGKSLSHNVYDNIEGNGILLGYEGFEHGEDGDPVATSNTTLYGVGGTPTIEDSWQTQGEQSANLSTNGDYVMLAAIDTTGVTYLTAGTDLRIYTSGSTGDIRVELLNSSSQICAGIKFIGTGASHGIQVYDSGSYASESTDFDYTWSSGDEFRVHFVYDTENDVYQVMVNGYAYIDGLTDTGMTISSSYSNPERLRVINSSASGYCYVDNMRIGMGTVSEVTFPVADAASLAETPHRKRGFLQYRPSVVDISNRAGSVLNNVLEFSEGKLLRGAVIEHISDEGKLYLSRMDPNVEASELVLNTWDAGAKNPFDISVGASVSVSLRLECNTGLMGIYQGGTLRGQTWYGAGPAYDTENATTLTHPIVTRFCHFYITHVGAGSDISIVEVWSRAGEIEFGYLSGYSVTSSGSEVFMKLIPDVGSGNFFEQSNMGCVNFYKQSLTPLVTEPMADHWPESVLYDIAADDDFIIIDEPYQPIAGIPRWQPHMQIGVSSVVTPNPATSVEHFQVRAVEPWPRRATETWSGVSHQPGFNDGDNIISDWMWEVEEVVVVSAAVDTETNNGFRNTGRVRISASTDSGDKASILHTTVLANRQTFRLYMLGSTTANGLISFKNYEGASTVIDLDISSGTIRDGSDATIVAFPDSTTWVMLDVEIDYGGQGLYNVKWSKIGTASSGETGWMAFDAVPSDNIIRQINIAATGGGSGTTIYVSRCEIFGGDRSDPKMYVHLTHTTNADRRMASSYDVDDADFRLWKWMANRAAIQPLWMNVYSGLIEGDSATVDMFYEHGANYTVEYMVPDGVCVMRGLLQDSSSERPIKMRAGEELVVTQELEINF